jgi:hypothetical protein
MWCPNCQQLVAGQKATHRARSITGLAAIPLTGGLSSAAIKSEGWHCPNCGQPVVDAKVRDGQVYARQPRGSLQVAPEVDARRRQAAAINDPEQAYCIACWNKIYAGDRRCPEGHPLGDWENEWTRSQGRKPKTRPLPHNAQPQQSSSQQPSGAPAAGVVEEIREAAELLKAKLITLDEFQELKDAAMARSRGELGGPQQPPAKRPAPVNRVAAEIAAAVDLFEAKLITFDELQARKDAAIGLPPQDQTRP